MPANPSPSLYRDSPPSLALMHAVFVLAGFGTLLLGPILPILSQRWQLTDSQSGLLLLAQFCGATLGGLTVSRRLQRDLLLGLVAGAAGFFTFAFAPYLSGACLGLLLGGFGVGRVIATVNIIAGARYTEHRGSALSRLNFTWSLGALLSPLLAAWLARFALSARLATFAALFLVCAITLSFQLRSAPPGSGPAGGAPQATTSLSVYVFLYFAALLFLYGGLETCLSAWLTTYALRYGQSSLVLSQYTLVLLLCGLTAGRALAAWLLLHLRETLLQRIALILSAVIAAAIATAHHAAPIAILAVLLGICLAPIFPATFALVMARRPSPRQAGVILAASGLGAAALPALMGAVSTRAGSLKLALVLPIATALTMLCTASFPPASAPPKP